MNVRHVAALVVAAGAFGSACVSAGSEPVRAAHPPTDGVGGAPAVAPSSPRGWSPLPSLATPDRFAGPPFERAQPGMLASTTAVADAPTGPPMVSMPSGQLVLGLGRELPIELRNVTTARLRVVPIDAREFDEASRHTGYFSAGDDPIADAGFRGRERTHFLDGNPVGFVRLGIDPFVEGRPKLVFVTVDAKDARPHAAIVQRGALNAVFKVGKRNGLVWAVDTSTGEPAAGARVVVRQGPSVRFHGRADKSGLVRLPRESHLRIQRGAAVDRPLTVYVRRGEQLGITTEAHSSGIDPWHFGAVTYDEHNGLRGTVTAERGIYRPGEDVHLLGVVRKRTARGKLRPPPGAATVTVADPDGTAISSKTIPLNAFGTFRSTVAVPRTARLGRYTVAAEIGGAVFRHRFDVGEYRPIRFDVSLPAKTLAVTEDGMVTVPLNARYLYGSPVANGAVDWTVSIREASYQGRDGFRYAGGWGHGSWSSESTGTDQLDANGSLNITFPQSALTSLRGAQKVEIAVEASVRDAAGDTVTGRQVLSHEVAETVVGVSNDRWLVSPTSGWAFDVVAETPGGRAVAGREISIEVERRRWVSVAEKTPWGTRYRGSYQTDVIDSRVVRSGKLPKTVRVKIPGGGNYRARIGLVGEEASVTTDVWAYGRGASAAWDNNPRISLKGAEESYAPGDVAKLFVSSPFQSATALVTVERDGILDASVERLRSAETPIDVRIDDRHAPNVFATVAVVPRKLGRKTPAAGPPFRMGVQELSVRPEQRRLRVDVTPTKTSHRPGDDARVRVRVRDHRGRPVRGEVTLWAADEGVLKLTGYETPDVFAAAYEPFPLEVRTSTNLLRWMEPDEQHWDSTGGDYASSEASPYRSRFLSTAFFSKRGVVTDAQGRAEVKIPLPDNLTAWRVIASVADTTDRFGAASASVTTSKPLQVLPALPRFLTVGDELQASWVVHNHTGASAEARVSVEISGARLTSPAEQTVRVENGKQQAVQFSVKAGKLGEVRFLVKATAGRETDAVQTVLPAHPPSPWQTRIVGDGRIGGTKDVSVGLPATAVPDMAKLTVSVSRGVLASLGGGLQALREYPHGCVEQTTSRLIPMVLLEDLLKRSGDTRLSGKAHRAKMEGAIAHVLKHQNADGGFGLWPTSDSEGFLTAYALWGLVTSNQNGYEVPPNAIERGYRYLGAHAEEGDDMHGQFSDLETGPFAAYVYSAAARDDGGLGRKLAKKRSGLSRFGQGLLGTAFAKQKGETSKQLLGGLLGAQTAHGNGQLIREGKPSSSTFGYGASLRATAVTTQALVRSGRPAAADALVRGILAKRRDDGSWGTTYNNLWALSALAEYAKHQAPPTPQTIRVEVDGRVVRRMTLSRAEPLETLEIPAALLPKPGQKKTVRLVAPAGSSARFEARLRYVDSKSGQAKVNRGFGVERQLLDAKTGAVVKTPKVGQLLRMRLVLDPNSETPQVALIDRLPAGLEPVDVNLATSGSARASQNGSWVWNELHDERVTFFANRTSRNATQAEYLVRATRAGTFVWPSPSAEAMYAPDVFGHGVSGQLTVQR